MKVKIEKCLPSGEIIAPPSKSYAHRLLICSALSKNGEVSGIIDSEDMLATLDCIKSLGLDYKKNGRTVSIFQGKSESNIFNCRESGSTLRFFIPIALARGGVCEFHGTERLISRGISVYEDICRRQNISVKFTDTSIVLEGRLKPDTFEVRGDISSQFISGLFFALPLLDGDSTVKITTPLESKPYIDITIDTLSRFGVIIEQKGDREFFIKGNQKYQSISTAVEGDFSNSAFLEAFGVLGTDISVIGLKYCSLQGDKVYKEHFEKIKRGYLEADISACPDLGPILIALCAARDGGYLTGTKRLKIKESDRAEAMATELAKFGIQVDVFENAVKIHKGKLNAPKEILSSHNDHRIVMSLCVISTLVGATIDGCEAVSKSYPDFFKDICSLGAKCEIIE